jgi:hypothetical protein
MHFVPRVGNCQKRNAKRCQFHRMHNVWARHSRRARNGATPRAFFATQLLRHRTESASALRKSRYYKSARVCATRNTSTPSLPVSRQMDTVGCKAPSRRSQAGFTRTVHERISGSLCASGALSHSDHAYISRASLLRRSPSIAITWVMDDSAGSVSPEAQATDWIQTTQVASNRLLMGA